MGRYIINGGRPLMGEADICGAKNAVLPLLCACLLTREEIVLHHCPRIGDVFRMLELLEYIGVETAFAGDTICVAAREIGSVEMPCGLSKKLRSSIFLLGSMVARERKAIFNYPGGCEIGARPVDQHLEALRRLGATVAEEEGRIICRAERLCGAHIRFGYPSVGATENAMLASVLAEGETVIENAAREPEIADLAALLVAMGAKISGAGSGRIVISGVNRLHGAEHICMSDRIEAGTFLAAVAAARGDIYLKNACADDMKSVLLALKSAGLHIGAETGGMRAVMRGRPRAFGVTTLPYPQFPTDMQAQMCAVAAVAEGTSRITETVFEDRMHHIEGLKAMGAQISLKNGSAFITGVFALNGAEVSAHELRGGAALTIAGLAAIGRTAVGNTEYIERGYEGFDKKLAGLGADIRFEPSFIGKQTGV